MRESLPTRPVRRAVFGVRPIVSILVTRLKKISPGRAQPLAVRRSDGSVRARNSADASHSGYVDARPGRGHEPSRAWATATSASPCKLAAGDDARRTADVPGLAGSGAGPGRLGSKGTACPRQKKMSGPFWGGARVQRPTGGGNGRDRLCRSSPIPRPGLRDRNGS